MILLIDNYDSFVHNLARYLELLGQETVVVRNDAIDLEQLRDPAIQALVVSPGPCAPDHAGQLLNVLSSVMADLPVLGVCLGHQAIVQAFGGKIVPSHRPVHGRTSLIRHDECGEFSGLPNPLRVARYHSLIADPAALPECLSVSARTEDGTIMSVRHRELPIIGWQFHPESILTESGFPLLAGFFRMANIAYDHLPEYRRELPDQTHDAGDQTHDDWPSGVTF